MVLILIAVLAAIAINAFINFRPEAESASVAANLKILRTGIAVQYSQMQLRCASPAGTFPPLVNLNANDITSGGAPCTGGAGGQVPIASEAQFVQGSIPVPLQNVSNVVLACSPGVAPSGCTRGDAVACDGTGVFTNRWCYNAATGELWMDDNPATAPNYEQL